MGQRGVITKETAEAILQSGRTSPGNAAAAARAADCDPRTAKKAWELGLRTCPDPHYHRPFKDILLEEQAEVRARVQREQEEASRIAVATEASRRGDVQAKAIDDVTQQRAQEERLVRNARAATIVLLSNVTNIAAGATALGAKVRESLEALAADGSVLSVTQAKNVVSLVGRLATSLRQLNDAGQKSMEMSRLLAGEPGKIVGIQHLQSIPLEEAKDRVAAAQRAIAELEEEGQGADQGPDGAALALLQ